MLNVPAELATPLPRTVVPEYRLTVLPASALPVMVGLVLLVRVPPVLSARLVGAAGGVVSMVMVNAVEVALVLPALSVAVAVRVCVPLLRAVLGVTLKVPVEVATTLPTRVLLANTLTVLPASALPVMAGLVLLVRVLPVLSARLVGAFGAMSLTTTDLLALLVRARWASRSCIARPRCKPHPAQRHRRRSCRPR